MLNLKTLLNKGIFTKRNGDEVIDLITRAVSFLGIRANSGQAHIVTEDTVMRADLISNHYYGDANQADLLLKYNGYSNPFSLNTGDIIRVPESEQLLKFGTISALTDLGKPRKKKSNILFQPTSRRDENRVKYLLQQSGATAPVPPNVAVNKAVTLVNGKIVFGRDVHSVTKNDCPDPISRTKLMETLIKNKLK